MDLKAKKRKLTILLVVLLASLILVLVRIIMLETRRGQLATPVCWGRPEEIILAVVFGILFVVIIRVSVLLQKIMDVSISGSPEFPRLSPEHTVTRLRAEFHFSKTAPRLVDPELFSILWASVFPVPLRVLIAIMVPLSLLLTGMLGVLSFELNKEARMLDKGQVIIRQGVISQVQKKTSRSGSYVMVDYTFYIPGLEIRNSGRSFAHRYNGKPGDSVQVESLETNPAISRVQGLGTSPVDTFVPMLAAVLLTALLLPGLVLYYVCKRRFIRALITDGFLVQGQIMRVKKGGRGMVFARAGFEHEGQYLFRWLAVPVVQGLYESLAARCRAELPVLLLVHPTRFRSVYLFEPHLKPER